MILVKSDFSDLWWWKYALRASPLSDVICFLLVFARLKLLSFADAIITRKHLLNRNSVHLLSSHSFPTAELRLRMIVGSRNDDQKAPFPPA